MSSNKTGSMRPGFTPESREQQLVGLAVDLTEKKIRDGTATSQMICHYLELGSTTQQIKKDILEEQRKLIIAKTEAIQSEQKVEELYKDAIAAMKNYSGNGSCVDNEDEDNTQYYD